MSCPSSRVSWPMVGYLGAWSDCREISMIDSNYVSRSNGGRLSMIDGIMFLGHLLATCCTVPTTTVPVLSTTGIGASLRFPDLRLRPARTTTSEMLCV